MARTNPPPKSEIELGHDLDATRWDYAPPPKIQWDQQVWPPDHALVGDSHWSALLQMRVNDFRRLVRQLGIRSICPGRAMFVMAVDLRLALLPQPEQPAQPKDPNDQ